jgi:hypothetical protein
MGECGPERAEPCRALSINDASRRAGRP